jgi:hypothetical protein
VNWRAIGCGGVAVVAFVLVGLWGISRAFPSPECPDVLPYEPASYRPIGDADDQPRLAGIDEELERAGVTSFGLATWEVWVEPGRVPAASAEPLPQRIVLACGDGTYQAYQRGTE